MNPDTDALCRAARACGYMVTRKIAHWHRRSLRPLRKADPVMMANLLDLRGENYRRYIYLLKDPPRYIFILSDS